MQAPVHGGTIAAGDVAVTSGRDGIVVAGDIATASSHGGTKSAGGVAIASAHGAKTRAHHVNIATLAATGNGGGDRAVGDRVAAEAANYVGRRTIVTGISLRLDAQHAAVVSHMHLERLVVIGADVVGAGCRACIPAQAPEILRAVARALLRGKGHDSSASVDGQAADDQIAAVIEHEAGIHQRVGGADFGNGADVRAGAEEDLVEHGPIRFFRTGRGALPDQLTPRPQAGHLQWLLPVDVNNRGYKKQKKEYSTMCPDHVASSLACQVCLPFIQ